MRGNGFGGWSKTESRRDRGQSGEVLRESPSECAEERYKCLVGHHIILTYSVPAGDIFKTSIAAFIGWNRVFFEPSTSCGQAY